MQHEAKAIEGLLDVEPGTGGDQASGSEGDELATGTNREAISGRLHGSDVDEALVEVELVFIDAGSWTTVAAVGDAAVELNEGSEALGEVQVGAQ